MSESSFNVKKALNLFGSTLDVEDVTKLEGNKLPSFARGEGGRQLKSWSLVELPAVGEKIGFLRRPSEPTAIAIFVTKGGVLKTSLTLNLARMAALHNIRTCVVGLDMQGDISAALGLDTGLEDSATLGDAMERISSVHGLADVFTGETEIDQVLRPTDIPTLFYVPETPELTALDQSLINRNRREYWLRDKVIAPLKEQFDLILMDCSPNWNRLITNALVAADILVSPLECKINNFRNFKTFRFLIDEFRTDLDADFRHIYIPTRLSPQRRLSMEIYEWYQSNISECAQTAIRESIQGEEASAVHLSIPEYAPTSAAADEIRESLRDLWKQCGLTSRPLTGAERSAKTKKALSKADLSHEV